MLRRFYCGVVTMARMKVTKVGRVVRVEVDRDLPRVGSTPSIVAGPSRTTIESPWVAVMGVHARRSSSPEVIGLSSSSDSEYTSDSSNESDSSSDRAPLTFRRTRQRGLIVLSDSDSDMSLKTLTLILSIYFEF